MKYLASFIRSSFIYVAFIAPAFSSADFMQCWNLGALSNEAAKVTLTVSFTQQPSHQPENLKIVGASSPLGIYGNEEMAVQQAFEVARRAILMCSPGDELIAPIAHIVTFAPTGVTIQ